jgi:Tol biopolymer transport system component
MDAGQGPAPGGWSNSAWFDLAVALLSLLTLSGVYLDGWAHNHDRVDQSFLTPWHAVLYASIAATGVFFGVVGLSNRSRGAPWREALPSAYRLSALGVALFLAAGITDLGWHAVFGIEQDTAALLSPTHLVLAFAGILILTGPWRAAIAKLPAGRLNWTGGAALVIAVACLVGILGFMTQYAHPVVDTIASRERPNQEALPDLYVMQVDGQRQTRLTRDSELWNGFGSWSPDGARILMTAGRPPTPSNLYILDSIGVLQSQLTRTPGSDYTASWSPDGRRIAFVSNTGPERRDLDSELLVVNVDGSEQRLLTTGGGRKWGTTWSPDSQRVAFSWRVNGTWQVFVVSADGSGLEQLTRGPRDSIGPAWSPDGRTIAFHRVLGERRSLIYLMDPDGNNLRSLAGTGDDYHPNWAPSGDRLAFTAFREGRGEIYLVYPSDGRLENLSHSAGLGYDFPAWSPDGRHLTFTAWAATARQDHELMRRLGVASVLLQTAVLIAPLLLVMRRWVLPFGAMTFVVGLSSLGAAVLRDHYFLLPAALAAGLAGDLMLQRVAAPARQRLLVFCAVVPALFYAFYFLTLLLWSEVDWNVHLWLGSVVLAGATGLAIAYLALPRQSEVVDAA